MQGTFPQVHTPLKPLSSPQFPPKTPIIIQNMSMPTTTVHRVRFHEIPQYSPQDKNISCHACPQPICCTQCPLSAHRHLISHHNPSPKLIFELISVRVPPSTAWEYSTIFHNLASWRSESISSGARVYAAIPLEHHSPPNDHRSLYIPHICTNSACLVLPQACD